MPSHQPTAGMQAVVPDYLSSQPSSLAKSSEPNRNRNYDPKKPHITETLLTRANWYKHVNWLNVYMIMGIPLLGSIQALWTPMRWQTILWAVVYYFWTGLGITAGEQYQSLLSPSFPYPRLTEGFDRLPSSLGSQFLLRHPSIPHLARCYGRRRHRGLHPLVVA